jgi:aspartyl-tRNA(Asn)/glutamyl-tRNA(Gln) amidotransferase subunit C
MPLERHEVEKIAHLARLKLSEAEISTYASVLSNILDLIAPINQANTDNIIPMAHPLNQLTQRLREDEITETNQRESYQAIAPATEAGLYLVPRVIETE